MNSSEQIVEDFYKFFRFVESLAPHIAKVMKSPCENNEEAEND